MNRLAPMQQIDIISLAIAAVGLVWVFGTLADLRDLVGELRARLDHEQSWRQWRRDRKHARPGPVERLDER